MGGLAGDEATEETEALKGASMDAGTIVAGLAALWALGSKGSAPQQGGGGGSGGGVGGGKGGGGFVPQNKGPPTPPTPSKNEFAKDVGIAREVVGYAQTLIGIAKTLPVGSAAETISEGASALVGATGMTAAVVVGGYIAAIAIVVAVISMSIFRGVVDAQFVSAALQKGQTGFHDDLVAYAVGIGTKTRDQMIHDGRPAASSAAWGAKFGAAMALAYNQVCFGGVMALPWGTAWTGWEQHLKFWADRGQYLVDTSTLEADIVKAMGLPSLAALSNIDAAAAAQMGKYNGWLMWAWMFARKQMIEPWHYDWFATGGGGQPTMGWSIGGWDPFSGGHALFTGLWMNPATSPELGAALYNEYNGERLTTEASVGTYPLNRTISGPFFIDWDKSTQDAPTIGLRTP